MSEDRELQPFQSEITPPPGKHRERQGVLRRLLSPGTIAKIAGYGVVDIIPTGWTPADVAVIAGGAMDMVAGVFQSDRESDERTRLIVRGILKVGAGIVPFIPSAPAGPIIDAASEVDRNRKQEA